MSLYSTFFSKRIIMSFVFIVYYLLKIVDFNCYTAGGLFDCQQTSLVSRQSPVCCVVFSNSTLLFLSLFAKYEFRIISLCLIRTDVAMLSTILIPVMVFAILHWRPHFDEISVRIIEAYDFLSLAVCHESVDILHIRIVSFKLFDEAFDITFLKIELAGIVLRNDFFTEELFPVFLFLQNQPFCQNHISIIVKDHLQTKQIMIELSGSLDILNDDQYIFQSHRFPSLIILVLRRLVLYLKTPVSSCYIVILQHSTLL